MHSFRFNQEYLVESLDDIIETLQIMKINVELICNENHPNLNQDLKEFIQISLNDLDHFRCQINQPDLIKRYFI